jgi:hypothetical protein
MLARLSGYYMVDLICDPDLLPFSERFGMTRYTGAIVRNPAALEARARQLPEPDDR